MKNELVTSIMTEVKKWEDVKTIVSYVKKNKKQKRC